MPRSYGGGDGLDNLRPAHTRCNQMRGNALPPDACATVIVLTGSEKANAEHIATHATPLDGWITRTAIARATSNPGTALGDTIAAASFTALSEAAFELWGTGPTVWISDPYPDDEMRFRYVIRGATVLPPDDATEPAEPGPEPVRFTPAGGSGRWA